MADTEFEQFRLYLEKFPCANSAVKSATQDIYSLVHDIDLDAESPDSPKSDDDAKPHDGVPNSAWRGVETPAPTPTADVDGVPRSAASVWRGADTAAVDALLVDTAGQGGVHRPERRRRRLPEIPKNKKSSVLTMARQASTSTSSNPPSLAEEMQQALQFAIGGQARPMLVLKCSHSYLRDEDSSPDSERFLSSEVDSGHSTAHSPDASPPPALSFSPVSSSGSTSSSSGGGGVPFRQLEMLEATHRGLHKFVPRHHDEIDVEIGDPIYVQKEADDLWCEGVNLRSGRQGIFPSAYAVDMDYSDFDPATPKVKRERYLLGYLGSVETRSHKGTSVLSQAVRKMTATAGARKPHSCILEVSDQGLRMSDKRPRPAAKDTPCLDYFYSLKNVSFCAFHPRDHRYMGFITKHPTLQRFACHVFLGQESTRPVAEAIGRAFQRFYTKYIETAFPIEDIYIE